MDWRAGRPRLPDRLDAKACALEGQAVVLERVRPTATRQRQPIAVHGVFDSRVLETYTAQHETAVGLTAVEAAEVGNRMCDARAQTPAAIENSCDLNDAGANTVDRDGPSA